VRIAGVPLHLFTVSFPASLRHLSR
jgi:hypothetical protein